MLNWYKHAQSANEPWTITQKEFLDYHKTGDIASDAYESYKEPKGIAWLGDRQKWPILYTKKRFGNYLIEFRKSGKPNKYCKLDNRKEPMRRSDGSLIFLTNEEMDALGYPKYDTTIAAFEENHVTPIGFASDEFGTDGVWVTEPYQRLGIGTYLLMEFRKQFPMKRKVGQMTNAGAHMTRQLHKQYVKQALERGLEIKPEVLKDYPDLVELSKKKY